MKRHFALVGILLWLSSSAQSQSISPGQAFAEFRSVCGGGLKVWKHSLCGPIIIVDPATRESVSNEDPNLPGFTLADGLWRGLLPRDISVANTSVTIGGRRFAEILLPLPETMEERRALFAHEAFHRIQPDLGFSGKETDNGHLDSKDARIFTRLEASALKRAITAKDWRPAARDALAYRAARLALHPAAETAETALLANEGLADYTGIVVGAGSHRDRLIVERLDSAATRPSLVRTYGYVVGAAYGLLLDRTGSTTWRSRALTGVGLPHLLAEALFSAGAAPMASQERDGATKIALEETTRELQLRQRQAVLERALVDGPTATFRFERMNIDFNPNKLFSLGDHGTVYSGGATIRDTWGELKVSGDVLVSPDWSFARVSGPARIEGQRISGPGWTADLAPGFAMSAGDRPTDSMVKRR